MFIIFQNRKLFAVMTYILLHFLRYLYCNYFRSYL